MFKRFKKPMQVNNQYRLDSTYTLTIASHAKMMQEKYKALISKEEK